MFAKRILKRIELGFWKATVRALKYSKPVGNKLRKSALDLAPHKSSILFKVKGLQFQKFILGILFVGLVSGSLWTIIPGSILANPETLSKQSNSLIALVEDAQAENSALLGLWLLAIPEGSNTLHWMPIYPVPFDDRNNSKYAAQHAPIIFDLSEEIQWEGIAPLRASGVFWEDTFVVDRAGVDLILNGKLGSEDIEMADSWDHPQEALRDQVAIISSFCVLSANDLNLDSILSLFDYGIHGKSTRSRFSLISSWDQFFANGRSVGCEYSWIQ